MTHQPDMPTTDEVRDKYAEFWIEGEYFGNDDPETRADFDRWLAKIKADAWGEGFQDGRWAGSEGDDGPLFTNPYLTRDDA